MSARLLTILFSLFAVSIALKCYTGEQQWRNGVKQTDSKTQTQCENALYCARQEEMTSYSDVTKVSFLCAEQEYSVCQFEGQQPITRTGDLQLTTFCCKGDYCNEKYPSSATALTSMIFSIVIVLLVRYL